MRPDAPSAHPSAEDLRRLLVGDLPEPDLDALAGHVEQCPDCAARLSPQLPDDPLIAALRQPLHPEDHAGEAECHAALARLSDRVAAERETVPPTEAEAADADGRARTDSGAAAGTVEVDLFAGRLPCPFGRYRIERRLGKGGMGAVYLAHDTTLDRPVAVKVSQFRAGEGAASERFLREARAAAGLHHDGVCRVLDYGVIDGTYYIAMDYVEGESLARRLACGEAQDPRWAARLVRQVALALAAVHERGIIHRDLKPGNVMLRPDGRPCVVDFGLARREQDQTITRAGTVMGTPAYMSPEQVAGEPVTQATDVYSLGVILYQLLTGRLPFGGENLAQLTYQIVHGKLTAPAQYRPGLDPALESVCLSAMARSPDDRYPTMAAFAEALDGYLDGTPARAVGKRRVARRPQSRRLSRLGAALRGRWWLVFFALLLAVGLPAASLLFLQGSGARPGGEQTVAVNSVKPPELFPAPPGGGHPPDSPVRKEEAGPPLAAQASPSPAQVGPPEAVARVSRSSVYQYVLKSTAWITTPFEGTAVGSGVVIDRDNRLVLTSYYAVQDVRDGIVVFPVYDRAGGLITERNVYLAWAKGNDAIKCKVLAHDKTRNLALIQLDRIPDGVEALPFAREEPMLDDDLHSVGNPIGGDSVFVYTPGVVRAVYTKTWTTGDLNRSLTIHSRVIEATSPSNPGDSGGPCVNDRGELVGITQGGKPGAGQAISLFIQASEAEAFIDEAFAAVPQLQGKTWSRSRRPTLAPSGGGKAERLAKLSSLLKMLESPDEAVRAQAAQGLALAGPDARLALPELLKALDDKNALVRRLVAQALTQIGQPGPKDLPELLPALDSASPEAKAYVLEALAVLGGEPEARPATRAVLRAAGDPDARVRQQAMRAVGTMAAAIGDQPARRALEKGLRDRDKRVRAAAAAAVTAEASMRTDVARLRELLADKEPEVRAAAALALGRLGDKARAAAPDLLAVARAEDRELRRASFIALKGVGADPQSLLPVLRRGIKDDDVQVRRAALFATAAAGAAAKDLLPTIVGALSDRDVRGHALWALRRLGPDAAERGAPVVADLLAIDTAWRLEALATLEDMKPAGPTAQVVVPKLIAVFKDDRDQSVRDKAAQVLGKIGKPAVAPLTEALNDPSPEVRRGAASALGAMGGEAKTVAPGLQAAIDAETNKTAREEESAALRRIKEAPDPK